MWGRKEHERWVVCEKCQAVFEKSWGGSGRYCTRCGAWGEKLLLVEQLVKYQPDEAIKAYDMWMKNRLDEMLKKEGARRPCASDKEER
jgi:hypothetical protein